MAKVVLMIKSKAYGMYGYTVNDIEGRTKSEIMGNAIKQAAYETDVPVRNIKVQKVM